MREKVETKKTVKERNRSFQEILLPSNNSKAPIFFFFFPTWIGCHRLKSINNNNNDILLSFKIFEFKSRRCRYIHKMFQCVQHIQVVKRNI